LRAALAHSGASRDDNKCELNHTRDCVRKATTRIFFGSIEA